VLQIKCPKCRGPVWEEDLPDSDKKIDLVCIVCGLRRFYDKKKYLEFKLKLERRYAADKRRKLSTR
jgi:predicted nucleic-acid-binding Zn-ribbon protein